MTFAEAIRDETLRNTVLDEPTFSLSNPPTENRGSRSPLPRARRIREIAKTPKPRPRRRPSMTEIRRAAKVEARWPVVALFWSMSLLGALSAIGVAIAWQG